MTADPVAVVAGVPREPAFPVELKRTPRRWRLDIIAELVPEPRFPGPHVREAEVTEDVRW
jgi:hypothetical protein